MAIREYSNLINLFIYLLIFSIYYDYYCRR